MKNIFLGLTFFIWYPIGMVFYVFILLPINAIYCRFRDKGKWLPREGRWENLKRGQWQDSLICKLTGHRFVDPRIVPEIIASEPQTEEMCADCGLLRNLDKEVVG
jgi:hypothetical protein